MIKYYFGYNHVQIDMLIWIEQLQKFYLSVEDPGPFFCVFPTAEINMY